MKLYTLWKLWEGDNLELLFALDEFTVEQNWEAWEDGCKAAWARYGITEADTRVVLIGVPSGPIADAFEPVEVEGSVQRVVPRSGRDGKPLGVLRIETLKDAI